MCVPDPLPPRAVARCNFWSAGSKSAGSELQNSGKVHPHTCCTSLLFEIPRGRIHTTSRAIVLMEWCLPVRTHLFVALCSREKAKMVLPPRRKFRYSHAERGARAVIFGGILSAPSGTYARPMAVRGVGCASITTCQGLSREVGRPGLASNAFFVYTCQPAPCQLK